MSEPKLVTKDPFLLIGLAQPGPHPNGFGALWEQFNPRVGEVPNRAGGECYGVCHNYQEDGTFEYVAAVPVCSLDSVPARMVGFEVPARTYAVFEVASLDVLGEAYRYAYEEWMPANGYRCPGGPSLEVYPPGFCPVNNPRLELWAAVEKADAA